MTSCESKKEGIAARFSDGNDGGGARSSRSSAAASSCSSSRSSDRTTRERDGRSEAGRARTLTTRETPTARAGARAKTPDTIDRETDAGSRVSWLSSVASAQTVRDRLGLVARRIFARKRRCRLSATLSHSFLVAYGSSLPRVPARTRADSHPPPPPLAPVPRLHPRLTWRSAVAAANPPSLEPRPRARRNLESCHGGKALTRVLAAIEFTRQSRLEGHHRARLGVTRRGAATPASGRPPLRVRVHRASRASSEHFSPATPTRARDAIATRRRPHPSPSRGESRWR